MYEEISTHTPVRVWQLNHVIRNAGKDFNSHTREGVTSIPQRYATWVANFNSHTREGVTLRGALRLTCWIISTHTPVRVWHALTGKTGATFVISTHTPVRVWRFSWKQLNASYNFNSHTREGVTMTSNYPRPGNKFQLTHPWGCDVFPFCLPFDFVNFNSHTREGVTPLFQLLLHCRIISTHTPVRVWLHGKKIQHLSQISTHTPVRVWQSKALTVMHTRYFNSHTREGVTRPERRTYRSSQISTHTPVRVWQVRVFYHYPKSRYFNSHTREGVT